jgi:ADP-ribosyltransferase exoenzyme
MLLDQLFELFEAEEERRYQICLKGEEPLNAYKSSNRYKEYYESFKSKVEQHEFGKTTPTGENLDAIKKYNIPIEEASIIYMYSAHHIHRIINIPLRMHPQYLDKDISEYGRLLDEALDKMPSFNNGIVYRDISEPICPVSKIIEYYSSNIGNVIIENTFLSTHIEKERWCDEVNGVQLIIQTNGNSNGKDIGELCFVADEKEVLFKKGTTFRVDKVDKENNIVELSEINTK